MNDTFIKTKSTNQINFIYGLKTILALMVFVSHWVQGGNDKLIKSPLTDLGGIAVVFFFVISGFLICKKYLYKFNELNVKDWKNFFINHFKKNYSLYFLLNLVMLFYYIFNNSYSIFGLALRILPSIFCIQSLIPFDTSISLNPVAWYLSCLMMLYAISPLLLYMINKIIKKAVIKNTNIYIYIVYLFCLIMTFVCSRYECLYITPYNRIFQYVVGMLTYVILGKNAKCSYFKTNVVQLSFTIMFFIVCFLTYKKLYFIVVFLFFASSFMLIFIKFDNGIISKLLSSKIMLFLGKISGDFYLIHYVVIKYFYCINKGNFENTLHWFLPGILCLIISVILSVLYHYSIKKISQKYNST